MKKPKEKLYPRLAVSVLIITYIILSVIFSFTVEPRNGPDEPAHFIYVREIGEYHRLPILSHEETRDVSLHASHEGHQPPLYYMLAAIPYSIACALGASIDTIWLIVRLFTILFGAGWVYFLYRLSNEVLGGNRYGAILSAAFIGLLPLATYMSSVVNNDAAIAMFFTAALWVIVKAVRRGAIDRRASIEIGLISGLAILSKSQGLFLLPVIAMAALIIAKRRGWRGSTSTLGFASVAIMLAAMVSSAWFIRNLITYGSPIIQSIHNPLFAPSDRLNLAQWLVAIQLTADQLFKYFWTPFWLLGLNRAQAMLYTRLLSGLCLLALFGVLVHFWRSEQAKSKKLDCRADVWGLLLLPGILIYIFLYRHTFYVDHGALQQGRLLLPAAGILGIGMVLGLKEMIVRPLSAIATLLLRSYGKNRDSVMPAMTVILGILLAACLVIANVIVLQATITYYTFH